MSHESIDFQYPVRCADRLGGWRWRVGRLRYVSWGVGRLGWVGRLRYVSWRVGGWGVGRY
jgi:hypothetical protein